MLDSTSDPAAWNRRRPGPPGGSPPIQDALQEFAGAVTAKSSALAGGGPEDQLRGPFEHLLVRVAAAWGEGVVCTGEAPLPGRLGRPDYAVHRGGALAGYVELKAPGTGADAARFKGRDRAQFRRFSAIPNLLYSDGNEWALYRGGERAGRVVRLAGDVASDGRRAVGAEDARALETLLRDFLSWEPVLPLDRAGRLDLAGFAGLLAPLCRLLRDDVGEALADPRSPLVRLARDWRQLLFPDATDEQFADAYAQTVAFALLLGRSEGADPLTLDHAVAALAAQHSLLSRALQVLTDPGARGDMSVSLDLLLRVVAVVPPAAFAGPRDPWLYFYEDFLAAYDPKLRKDAGAYYTPVEVVRAQVRLVDALLVSRLGRPLGFADPGVVTLDPAAGTGTYLLGVIEHALGRIEAEQGAGAVAGQAAELAGNLYGFELMVGPYAVSELRVSRALRDRGAPPGRTARVYLTDTLESPRAEPPQLPLFMQPISEQRERALAVKREAPVIVCLGNPPYDRHEAARADNGERTGGWVRWGDDGKGTDALLRDFLAPVAAAGHGVHVKNLYNLYVYFWRWALWKVFEQAGAEEGGVVSFVTASSWLDGDAFGGMREHLRRVCDEVWILDLGGEGRGTRRSENVFAIRTPVAIAVAFRAKGAGDEARPAVVRYVRIEGSREEKLSALGAVEGFGGVGWRECAGGWQAPFRPAGEGEYFGWPLLSDLMPWQHSGVQLKRTWPIAPDAETLGRRWRALLATADPAERARAFKETRDRTIGFRPPLLSEDGETGRPIAGLPRDAPAPRVERYAYRSFDRQWILVDTRLGDYLRPDLWRVHGERQVYLTSLLYHPLDRGPALTACAHVPDLHHFSGRGAKDTIPLYRTADASEANVLPGLLDRLGAGYGRPVTPEDFAAYVYGVSAHPAFTARFSGELETRELRIPVTRDSALFEEVRSHGARLLWLHTWGERFASDEPARGRRRDLRSRGLQPRGRIPSGAARCTKAVPGDEEGCPSAFRYDGATRTLHVGEGEYAPVAPEVYGFEVSGLKVVQSWLRYRMRNGAGRASSPLDGIRPGRWTSLFTTELLELLWVLEATVEGWPEQERLLEAVLGGGCLRAGELPPVPEEMRKAPRARKAGAPSLDLDG